MITDHTLDQSIIEATRFIKAAKALRAARKLSEQRQDVASMPWWYGDQIREHAATLRASMDLTHKLADLRQSR